MLVLNRSVLYFPNRQKHLTYSTKNNDLGLQALSRNLYKTEVTSAELRHLIDLYKISLEAVLVFSFLVVINMLQCPSHMQHAWWNITGQKIPWLDCKEEPANFDSAVFVRVSLTFEVKSINKEPLAKRYNIFRQLFL